jgi:hypothetical protein
LSDKDLNSVETINVSIYINRSVVINHTILKCSAKLLVIAICFGVLSDTNEVIGSRNVRIRINEKSRINSLEILYILKGMYFFGIKITKAIIIVLTR